MSLSECIPGYRVPAKQLRLRKQPRFPRRQYLPPARQAYLDWLADPLRPIDEKNGPFPKTITIYEAILDQFEVVHPLTLTHATLWHGAEECGFSIVTYATAFQALLDCGVIVEHHRRRFRLKHGRAA